MKYHCSCCSPAKSYTKERNLYRHERQHNKYFIEPFILKQEKFTKRRLEYESNPIFCLQCNIAIPYKRDMRNMKYCSYSCAAKINNKYKVWQNLNGSAKRLKIPKVKRNCLGCGLDLRKNTKFYCSVKCQVDVQRKQAIEIWLNGGTGGYANGCLSRHIRNYLLEQADYKCSECGWGKINPLTGKSPLNVDHIDGDSSNHRPENLKVLCPNCHSLTPTYGSLNIGKGREQRRNYRQQMKSEGRLVA